LQRLLKVRPGWAPIGSDLCRHWVAAAHSNGTATVLLLLAELLLLLLTLLVGALVFTLAEAPEPQLAHRQRRWECHTPVIHSVCSGDLTIVFITTGNEHRSETGQG
jgi:hypothetical protein